MINLKNEFNLNGFLIKEFKNKKPLNKCKEIIMDFFNKNDEYYSNLSTEEYRKLVLDCTKAINQEKIQKKIVENERSFFDELIAKNLKIQSVVYFRTARPQKPNHIQEQLDFHRETFYSDFEYIKKQFNFWFPIKNLSKKNSMKYIPFSHKLEDRDIITKDIEMKESGVKKFSVGHKIGLLYKPKKIISGVDFTKQKNLFVPNGSFVIFSSMLIHGAAINYDNKIRYSCDFGLLDEEVVDDIKFSFAGDRPQYLSYEEL
jgi:ectoine hydroxylase-related dioxygenase (phytanoyl-CoA dioxygenase family)